MRLNDTNSPTKTSLAKRRESLCSDPPHILLGLHYHEPQNTLKLSKLKCKCKNKIITESNVCQLICATFNDIVSSQLFPEQPICIERVALSMDHIYHEYTLRMTVQEREDQQKHEACCAEHCEQLRRIYITGVKKQRPEVTHGAASQADLFNPLKHK